MLGIAGALFRAVGAEGEDLAWMVLGVGVAWIFLMIWWALRAPAQLSEDAWARYLPFLRHGHFRPLDNSDDAKRGRR